MDSEGTRAVQVIAERLAHDEDMMRDFKAQLKTLNRALWTLVVSVIIAAMALIGNLIDNAVT